MVGRLRALGRPGVLFIRIYAGILIFSTLLGLPLIALANNEPLPLYVRQMSVNMPEIAVYFGLPENMLKRDGFLEGDIWAKASLSGENLSSVSLSGFETSGEGVWYIFTVDCSNSMTDNQIAAICGSIEDIAGKMGENDRFTLISFGLTVDVPLHLSGDALEIIDAAAALKANQNGTLFYDAIVKALEYAASYGAEFPIRRAIFLFSDAEDYNVGGYVLREVEELLARSDAALYAFGFINETNARAALDVFGAMARLTPGGGIDIVTSDTARGLANMRADGLKSGYVAHFSARTNIVGSEAETFVLEAGSDGSAIFKAIVTVTPKRWIPDRTPPIVSAKQMATGTLRFDFSEPMLGANRPEGFHIEDEDGNLIAVRAVTYNNADTAATLSIDVQDRSGKLMISFLGVTDASMEKNTLSQSVMVNMKGVGGVKITPQSSPAEPLDIASQVEETVEPLSPLVWLISSLPIALAAVGVIFGVIKSRGGLISVDGKLRFAGGEK